MLENTQYFIKKTEYEIEVLNLIMSYLIGIITLIYPCFALAVGIGNRIINIIMLVLASIYTASIYFLKKREEKKKSKRVKRIYKWLRILLLLVALAITLYGIYSATSEVNGIAIILATLMIIFWVIKVAIALFEDLIVPRLETLKTSLIEDLRPYCDRADSLLAKARMKPMFNLKEESSDALIKQQEKVERLELKNDRSEIKKDIKRLKGKLYDEIDSDNNGEITKHEIIRAVMNMPSAVVNKNEYLTLKLLNKVDKEVLKVYIKSGPIKAGINNLMLDSLVKSEIEEFKDSTLILNKYLMDGVIEEDTKSFNKIFHAAVDAVIGAERIMYLYGFPPIKELDSFNLRGIDLAMHVVMDDYLANDSKNELINLLDGRVIEKIKTTSDDVKDKLISLLDIVKNKNNHE